MADDDKARAQERVAMARVALEEKQTAYDKADNELHDAIMELDDALTALDYPPKNPPV